VDKTKSLVDKIAGMADFCSEFYELISWNAVVLTKEVYPCRLENSMPKRTFQPKKRHAAKQHGFLKRMASRAGRKVIKRRRLKARTRLTK
jgi:large subunit ribosomal protein L34